MKKNMSRIPMKIQLQPINKENQEIIFDNFVDIKTDRRSTSNFCVDGRKGKRQTVFEKPIEGPYVQSLGGSLHPAVLNWILVKPQYMFDQVVNTTFNTLKIEKGYRIGLHTGHHADNQEKSDCGFADNLGKIIERLKSEEKEIWEMLINADPSLTEDKNEWKVIIDKLSQVNTSDLPNGHSLIYKNTTDHHADIQKLEGEHQEIAAVVNTKPNTTLDVDSNQKTQAFNLDLWWVLEQAKELGIEETKAKLLSLGLYVATEKVLVEDKRGIKLPIIIKQ